MSIAVSTTLMAVPASLTWQMKEQQARTETIRSAQQLAGAWVRHYNRTGRHEADLTRLDMGGSPGDSMAHTLEDRYGNKFRLLLTPANTRHGQVERVRAIVLSPGPDGKTDSSLSQGRFLLRGDDLAATVTLSQLEQTERGVTEKRKARCNRAVANFALINEGAQPAALSDLIRQQYLTPMDITDGWGRLLTYNPETGRCHSAGPA